MILNQATVTEEPTIIKPQRLSESPLWDAQKKYFVKTGIEAWRQNIVPSYVTTNPFIAHTYAELVLAYLEDYQRKNKQNINQKEPFYIFDLGAGSGKFTFHFLRHFLPEFKDRFADISNFCYVMVDISQANIDFWQSHEQLKPFVEEGVLDFAQFDVCQEQCLKLLISGNIISAETQNKPIVAIANYLFDSLPHDVFELQEGKLFECLVSLHQQGKTVTEEEDLRVESLGINYHNQVCDSEYYDDKRWNNVLNFYQDNIEDGIFLLPVGGFRCLENLTAISKGQFMVLSADKGHHHLESVIRENKPNLVKHGGCVSFTVNYHALTEYFKQLGGEVLQIPHLHNSINIQAFLLGETSGEFKQTKRVYQQKVIDFSPDDFFMLKKATENNYRYLDLRQIIALLRLSHWDTDILNICSQRLIQVLSESTQLERKKIYNAFQIIRGQYYFLEENENDSVLKKLEASLGNLTNTNGGKI